MLKINLLPNARKGAAAVDTGSAQTFLLMTVVALVLLAAALIFFHSQKKAALDELNANNAQLDNQVRSIRSRVSDHDRIRADLAAYRAREEAIATLETARRGPTAMLIELSHLLSEARNAQVQVTVEPQRLAEITRNNPQMLPTPDWDNTNLWLTKFEEAGRNVTIEGQALSDGDVSEFMRRLLLSEFFRDVRLVESLSPRDAAIAPGSVPLHKFKLTARVRY